MFSGYKEYVYNLSHKQRQFLHKINMLSKLFSHKAKVKLS